MHGDHDRQACAHRLSEFDCVVEIGTCTAKRTSHEQRVGDGLQGGVDHRDPTRLGSENPRGTGRRLLVSGEEQAHLWGLLEFSESRQQAPLVASDAANR